MSLEKLGELNNIEQEFKEKLGENSDEFLMLQELVKSGKYTWEKIEEKVEIEDGGLIWRKGDLDIRGTNVKKVKAKKIGGDLDAWGVKSLEEINVEEIGWNLKIEGTSVTKVKVKKIKGNLYAKNVENLEEINVEEIGGRLDIRGTNIDFQLKLIEKINKGELGVNGEVFFGGNVEGIEKLVENKNLVIPGSLDIIWTNVKEVKVRKIGGNLYTHGVESLEEINVEEIGGFLNISGTKVKKIEVKKIGGSLNIKGTSVEFQLKVIEKINKKELKVNWDVYFGGNVKGIEKLVENENLVIPGSLDISGTNIKKIKAKRIGRSLYARNIKNLEKIEVKEIGRNLDIRGTSIEFQMKVIKKIRKGKLKVKGSLYYDESKIDVILTKDGELKDIFEEESGFYERYGKKYKEIEDEGLKKEAEEILNYAMKSKRQEVVDKIVKYANNQNKEKIKELAQEWEEWKIGYKEFMNQDFRIIGQCFKNKK